MATLPAYLEQDYFLLEARFGGEGPYRLVLDTGSSVMILTPDLASRLAARGLLQDAPDARATGVTRKTRQLNGVEVLDLRLGSHRVPRVYALVTDLRLLSRALAAPVDGIAGLNLFREVRLDLDYPAGRVRVEPLDAPLPHGARRVPLLWQGGVPALAIELAGKEQVVKLDSGASDGFYLGPGRRLPLASRPRVAGISAAFGARIENKAARLATNIIVAGLVFERPIVYVDEKLPRLGAEVLKHFRVGLNQRELWVSLTPATTSPVTAKPLRSPGLALAPHERGLEIMGVIPGTDAARARLRRGDIITRLNGEPATTWTKARRQALVEEADRFVVDVVRGSESRRHRIEVAVLVE